MLSWYVSVTLRTPVTGEIIISSPRILSHELHLHISLVSTSDGGVINSSEILVLFASWRRVLIALRKSYWSSFLILYRRISLLTTSPTRIHLLQRKWLRSHIYFYTGRQHLDILARTSWRGFKTDLHIFVELYSLVSSHARVHNLDSPENFLGICLVLVGVDWRNPTKVETIVHVWMDLFGDVYSHSSSHIPAQRGMESKIHRFYCMD